MPHPCSSKLIYRAHNRVTFPLLGPLFVMMSFSCFAEDVTEGPVQSSTVTIPTPAPLERILDKDVGGWIEHLKNHENEQERKLALLCIADFGAAASEAVPELMALMKDELQPETQRWSIEVLGAIGAAAKSAVPSLLTVFNDPQNPAVFRAAACAALAQIEPESPRIQKVIINAMRDRNREIRNQAIDAAVSLAPFSAEAATALANAVLVEADAVVAASALRSIGHAGWEPLLNAVERGGPISRRVAGEALGHEGVEVRSILQRLLRILKRERDSVVRAALLLAAARIDLRDPIVLESLIESLAWPDLPAVQQENSDDDEPGLRARAIRLLTVAGQTAIPALRKGLLSRDAAIRLPIVGILAKLALPPADVVDDLISRLQDRDAGVRVAAARVLDSWGPLASKAQVALLAMAERESQGSELQRMSALAALNVSRDPGRPRLRSVFEMRSDAELIAALRDSLVVVRQEAAEALRTRSTDAGPVAGALLDALNDTDERVRISAAHSLVRFGKYARVAMPTFIEWLDFSDSSSVLTTKKEGGRALTAIRKAALAALAGMGVEAKPALPAIVQIALSPSADNDEELQNFLALALRMIGPDAVPGLSAELKNPDAVIRERAARVLASMGPVAATSIPDLIELSKSAVDSDARAGLAGLQAMGPVAYSAAAPYLVNVLRGDIFEDRRMWATYALGDIRVPEDGDKADVIDALLLALLDPEDGVCRGAHGALVRIGQPALPKLRTMLKLGEGEAPYWAVRVLARLKADPSDVIPRLVELTHPGKRPVERGTAAELLGEYAPDHPDIIPVLLRVLGDREDYVARAAMRSMVPFGAQMIPPLRQLIQHRTPRLRHRALEALEYIHKTMEN